MYLAQTEVVNDEATNLVSYKAQETEISSFYFLFIFYRLDFSENKSVFI